MDYPTFPPSVSPSIRPNVASISTAPISSFGRLPVLSITDIVLAVLAIPVHPAYAERYEAPLGLLGAGTVEVESLYCSSTMTFWTT